MTENQLRALGGLEPCDCDECRTKRNDMSYAAPDIYAEPLAQLRAAEATTNRASVAEAKATTVDAQLRALASTYSAEQNAAFVIEDSRKTVLEAARQRAAREMGVEPHTLQLVEAATSPSRPRRTGISSRSTR
jgi:hypothetical protein